MLNAYPASRRETVAHIALIGVVFVVLFYLRGGFLPGQAGCDDPVFIRNAVYFWTLGKAVPLFSAPLYHDIITPFVAIFFEPETGFIVWRFLILLTTILLLYFNVAYLARPWVGLVAALHFQLIVMLFMTGAYFTLAMALALGCNLILLYRPNRLGVVAGILLLGMFVRGELALILLVVIGLSAVFAPRALFQARVLLQFAPFGAAFVGLIYLHHSTLSEFPHVFSSRGSYAYFHYIGKSMYEMGYLKKYTDKTWGHIEIPALDRASQDVFGKTMTQFRDEGGLHLREMFAANPKFMTAHYHKVFATVLDTLPDAFAPDILFPADPRSLRQRVGDWRHVVYARAAIHLGFVCLAVLPFIVLRARGRRPTVPCAPTTRQATFLMLAPFSAFATWFLTMPMAHYIVFIVPTTYLALILLARRVAPWMIGCAPRTGDAGPLGVA